MHEQHGDSAGATQDRRRRRGRLVRMALLALVFAVPAAGAVLNLVGIFIVLDVGNPAGIAVSPTGGHVYVVNDNDDALVVYTRDATAESLGLVEVLFDQVGGVFGLDGASSVIVSTDSRHVYATGEIDDALAVFARDASSDSLTFVADYVHGVGGVLGLDGASGLTLSDDGRHVYTTASLSGAVALFVRDASLDTLAFADVVIDGSGGVDGLAGARSAAYFSYFPKVNRLFVAAPDDDSVAVLVPDSEFHVLQFLGHIRDGVGTVDGLDGASAVLLSPDGTYLYIAGRDEDALAVFDIDGSFHFPNQLLQVVRDGQNGVTGLDAPTALALSGDGRFLYAAIAGGGSAVVFRRELDGRLTFLPDQVDTGGALLEGTRALATTPDGKHLLAAARANERLGLFRQDGIFSDGFESGDISVWSNAP